VSAEILKFSGCRVDDGGDVQIDLVTARDVAARDLREILLCRGSETAQECELMLRRAYSGFVFGQPGSR
jgi:hypothetical protein